MENLTSDLARLGFTEKEAAAYLAALELGNASAQQIANRAKINRATAYTVLENLMVRGLITPVAQNGERRFVAESPLRLVTMLNLQAEEIKDRERLAQALLPGLQAFYNASLVKPKIRYIEGVDGLRMMRREHENASGDIIQIVGFDAFMALHDPRSTTEHQQQLAEHQRKVRSIIVTDRQVDFHDHADIDFVVVSPTLCPIKGEMTVSGDKLVLFAYTQGIIAIEITSSTIADVARSTLELAWKEAQNWATSKKIK
jgi:sugar-specific transcriptional regulator TrmB